MSKTLNTLALAALVTGAVTALSAPAQAQDKEKCYGIAEAGKNDCANLAGTHSCAGQSTVSYDMGEWKLVAKGTCEAEGGSLTGGTGMNPKKSS